MDTLQVVDSGHSVRDKSSHWLRNMRSLYHYLAILHIAWNLVLLVLSIAGVFPPGSNNSFTWATANLAGAVLIRNDVFVQLLYMVVCTLARPCCLSLRLAVTEGLLHVGGLHVGGSVSCVMWLLYTTIQMTLHQHHLMAVHLVFLYAMLLFLLAIICASHPVVRDHHHDLFEQTHRFMGVGAVLCLWVFVFLRKSYDLEREAFEWTAHRLLTYPPLWLSVIVTLSILLPWLSVRKVPVEIWAAPAGNVVVVKFNKANRRAMIGRISRRPLRDWHAFGLASDGKSFSYMVCTVVGDFTRSLVDDPPHHLYHRMILSTGLPYCMHMFDRLVLYATGSAIGIWLAWFLQPSRQQFHIIWIGHDIEHSNGPEVLAAVRMAKGCTIIDTAREPQPDSVALLHQAYRDLNAEAIFLSSNPDNVEKLVRACRGLGMMAFGPIFDS